MTGFVFVFVCIAFNCHGVPIAGDGVLYETRGLCKRAAYVYAANHSISLGRYEIACTERTA